MDVTEPARPSVARNRWRRPIAAVLVAAVVLAGCGSDDDGDEADAAGVATFCDAVARYAEAAPTNDVTAMADAIAGSGEGLDADDRRLVDAYYDALTAPPPNHSPASDEEERTTEGSFRALAEEHCGADAVPAADTTSTPTGSPSDGTTTTAADEAGSTTSTSGPGPSANEADDGPTEGGDGDGGGQGDGGAPDENEAYPSDTEAP